MNSQIVVIKDALKSRFAFILLLCAVVISLFLKAGFISTAVIWFSALCLFNYTKGLKQKFKNNNVLLYPIFLFILYVFGLLLSTDIEFAINMMLMRKIHLLLVPLGFIISKKVSKKDIQIVLTIFLTACLLCSLICIFIALYNIIRFKSLAFEPGQYYYFSSDLLTEVVNIAPVYLSMYCNFALLISLYTPIIKQDSYKLAIATYFSIFIIMCAAKIGIITLCIVVILWLVNVHYRKKLLFSFITALGVVITFICLYLFIFKENASILFKFTYTNQYGHHTADKLSIWSLAIETIQKNPVIGYGTGSGEKAFERAYVDKELIQVGDPLNPHNEFFSATLDLGLAGGCMVLIMLVLPFIYSIRTNDPVAFGFIVIAAFFFCVESVLFRQKGIVFFSFFYSLLYAKTIDDQNSVRNNNIKEA